MGENVDAPEQNNIQPDPAFVVDPAWSQKFTGWETYPETLSSFNPFACDAASLRARLREQSLVFVPPAATTCDVRTLDLDGSRPNVASKEFIQPEKMLQFLGSSQTPDLRIISIFRKDSMSQLRITSELMQKILHLHQIGPCFSDLVTSFRGGEDLSEKGHYLWASPQDVGKSQEICYILRYMHNKGSAHAPFWTERQIGVYHRFGSEEKAVMILLHTGEVNELDRRIKTTLQSDHCVRAVLAQPMLLHTMILSNYLDNWRPVLRDKGSKCKSKEDKYMTNELKEMDASLGFDELQELRHLQSRLVVASSILRATIDIASVVKAQVEHRDPTPAKSLEGSVVENATDSMARALPSELESVKLKCSGYLRSVEVLQLRLQALMRLLSDGLNIQNQQSSSETADATYILTKKSVDDNAIVRVITVITLIYLPVQGVATFFGMNLTVLPEDTNVMRFANNWWLFVACAVPITALTLGVLCGAVLWEREKRKRGRGRKAQSARAGLPHG